MKPAEMVRSFTCTYHHCLTDRTPRNSSWIPEYLYCLSKMAISIQIRVRFQHCTFSDLLSMLEKLSCRSFSLCPRPDCEEFSPWTPMVRSPWKISLMEQPKFTVILSNGEVPVNSWGLSCQRCQGFHALTRQFKRWCCWLGSPPKKKSRWLTSCITAPPFTQNKLP